MTNENKKSFIEQIPAILGGIAAVITAIAALVVALAPSGDSEIPEVTPNFAQAAPLQPSTIVREESITEFSEIHGGDNYWAKQGYYLNADNSIQIWPTEISNVGANVFVSDNTNTILLAETLDIGESINLDFNNATYRITLVNTGRAGKNPFNKAAFFKVERT